MMSNRRKFLSRLDAALRWTGFPARVAADLSDPESPEHRRRPLRWLPIGFILFACALFILSVSFTPPMRVATMIASFAGTLIAFLPMIHSQGPLGKSWTEDDEREAALRMRSWLFCFGVLAVLNCLGQPVLMMLSHLKNWQTSQVICAVIGAFALNAALFGCLPTLYASWNLKKLPRE